MITIGLLSLVAYQSIQERKMRSVISNFLQSHAKPGGKVGLPSTLALAARRLAGTISDGYERQLSPCINPMMSWREENLYMCRGKEVISLLPRPSLDVSEWTSYLDSPTSLLDLTRCSSEELCVLLEAERMVDPNLYLDQHADLPSKCLRLESVSQPIAWRAGPCFGILVRSSVEELHRMIEAFLDDTLATEDPLVFNQILVVRVEWSPTHLLSSRPGSNATSPIGSPAYKRVAQRLHLTQLHISSEGDAQNNTRTQRIPAIKVQEATLSSDESGSEGSIWEALTSDDGRGASGQGNENGPTSSGHARPAASPEMNADSVPHKPAPPLVNSPVSITSAMGGVRSPNLLVLGGQWPGEASSVWAAAMGLRLTACVRQNTYTVYPLTPLDFKQDVWQEVATLLCMRDSVELDSVEKVIKYLIDLGGRSIVVVCSDKSAYLNRFKQCLDHRKDVWSIVELPEDGSQKDSIYSGSLCLDKNKCLMVRPSEGNGGLAFVREINLQKDSNLLAKILSLLNINCEETKTENDTPPPTSLYLRGVQNGRSEAFLKLLFPDTTKPLLLKYASLCYGDASPSAEVERPLAVLPWKESSTEFNFDRYFRSLRTSVLGQVLMHADVVESSFSLLEDLTVRLPPDSGLVISSSIQTKGKGRVDNKWISPKGQAMFSYHLSAAIDTPLARHPSFVQHMAAMSIVLACNKWTGGKDFGIRVKWPNDVVVLKTGKMAGILVRATFLKDHFHFLIGCGINVTNRQPAICLVDILESHFPEINEVEKPTLEDIVAGVMNEMDALVTLFQTGDDGVDQVVRRYTELWAHSGQKVTVRSSPDHTSTEGIEAVVTGVDEYGYLLVEDATGHRFTLHPDGNSFDMMKNLVIPKLPASHEDKRS